MEDYVKTIQHLERENITLKALVEQLEHDSQLYDSSANEFDELEDTNPSSNTKERTDPKISAYNTLKKGENDLAYLDRTGKRLVMPSSYR